MMLWLLRPRDLAQWEVRVLRDPASLTATRTIPSGPTPHELIGATIVRRREIRRIRPEIRFIRHGTSPMFPS